MSATETATNVQMLEKQLNDEVSSGKFMDAFDKYYADDVVMQENSEEPRKGKAANRKTQEEFMSSVETFHDAKLTSSAVNGDVTFSEWEMDFTFKGGHRTKMNEVAVRKWKNGKVAHERFFYNKG